MCEVLKGRRIECPEYLDMDGFDFDSVKSAVKGLIKYHEDKIEEAIKELETKLLGHAGRVGRFITIREERKNIMVIEHWLEDAI